MGSTLHCHLVHIIFSTKDRAPSIPDSIAPRLYAYLGGIARNRNCPLISAGGIEDHIHLLVDLHPTTALADFVRDLKSNASRWMHDDIKSPDFAWQTGYAAFSVSRSNAQSVEHYIANQRDHHNKLSFKDELIQFLQRHNVPYDPAYIFA